MKKYVSLILLFFILLINNWAYSCSIFEVSSGEKTLVGNNEDWIDMDCNDSMVWFLPAAEDKYGRVFFGWKGAGPEGGMNDQGLFFDWVAHTPRVLLPIDPNKKVYNGSECDLLLEKCSNINEALEILKTYNFPTLGYAEIMVVDEAGNSAVVTWDWNKNELSIKRSNNKYQIIGYGYNIVKPILEQEDSKLSIEKFRSMLEASKQGSYTVYSNIYDLKNKDIYVYFNHDFQKVVKFNLNNELKKGSHFDRLYSLFPNEDNKITVNNFFFRELSIYDILILLIFGISFISMIIIWLIQLIKSLSKLSGNKVLRISILLNTIAGLNSLICLVTLYLIAGYANFIYKYGFGFLGDIQRFIPSMIITFTSIQLIFAIALWKLEYLTLISRMFYSVSTFVAISFIICLNVWGMIKI